MGETFLFIFLLNIHGGGLTYIQYIFSQNNQTRFTALATNSASFTTLIPTFCDLITLVSHKQYLLEANFLRHYSLGMITGIIRYMVYYSTCNLHLWWLEHSASKGDTISVAMQKDFSQCVSKINKASLLYKQNYEYIGCNPTVNHIWSRPIESTCILWVNTHITSNDSVRVFSHENNRIW